METMSAEDGNWIKQGWV